jgi:WhiB family transcriptional regulator, redox-sensing transcriptional regulator
MSPRKVTDQDIDELVRRYQDGESMGSIGEAIGVSRGTVAYHLRERGIRIVSNESLEQIAIEMGTLRYDWGSEAECRDKDVSIFFPERDGPNSPNHTRGDIKKAKRICGRCEVRESCLVYALETGQRYGVWGGLTPNERKALRRRMDAQAIKAG